MDTLCPHCHQRPRARGQRWCKECRNAARSQRKLAKAEARVTVATSVETDVDTGNGHSGHAGHGSEEHTEEPPPTPRALGRQNGAGAKALMDGLQRIAMGTEPNPWPILALWKHLRDTVDGLPKPAPEVKDPRRLARIILTNGHASSPPAKAAEPAEPPRGWHEEDGQRFVSVPPE